MNTTGHVCSSSNKNVIAIGGIKCIHFGCDAVQVTRVIIVLVVVVGRSVWCHEYLARFTASGLIFMAPCLGMTGTVLGQRGLEMSQAYFVRIKVAVGGCKVPFELDVWRF